MTGFLRDVVSGALDLVYPPKCLVCNEIGPRYLCDACIARISPVREPFCPVCGHTLFTGRSCSSCSDRPPSFTKARAIGSYEGVLREAVHHLKFGGARCLAEPLGDLMVEALRSSSIPLDRIDRIHAMPMHPVRRRLRGYNQSALLAERVASIAGIPMVSAIGRSVVRSPQVDLSRADRLANVRGVFNCERPDAISGETVLLIDDVSTTSSTVHECSSALLTAGASKVYVFCLAFDE